MSKALLVIVFVLFSASRTFADPEAKNIAYKYATGVVKILLYDPTLVKKFDLDDDEGYLTRGSGFFVTPGGLILTNRHVVEWCVYGYMVADWVDEDKQRHDMDILTYEKGLEKDSRIKKIYYAGHATPMVQVFNNKGDKDYELYKAEVVIMGEEYDGAIIKIVSDLDGDPIKQQFVALPLGDASKVPMGEDLVILGFPAQYAESDLKLDLRDTVTMSFGRHSGWDYVFSEDGFIKSDAAIHEGNSGGPAFDDNEKVIGIATAMGVKTEIGLIEPINDMYYLAAANPDILSVLINDGLVVPKDRKRVKTVSGGPQPLPKLKLAPMK